MKSGRVNKTSFIIVRVTDIEKEYLIKLAKKANIKKLSKFVRQMLGLQK